MTIATDFKPCFKVEAEKQRGSWCYRVLLIASPGHQSTVSEGWIKSGARSRQGCVDRGYAAAASLLPGLSDQQDTIA